MTTRVTIAGHPLHPMLVTLPIGLWIFSLVSDLVFVSNGDARWETTAYLTLGGGLAGALLAAIPGLLDLLGLHDPQERRVGTYHLVLNLAIVVLQAVNFWLRSQYEYSGSRLTVWLSVIAVAALVISGWLGGKLVHVFGVTQPQHASAAHAPQDRLHPRT